MSSPIPFLLFGKSSAHLSACTNIVQPNFEVAKSASNVNDAKTAVQSEQYSFIAMGAGFSMKDFETVHNLAKRVPWFRPHITAPDYSGSSLTGPPSAEMVSSRLRKALDVHAEDIKQGKGAGEVWYF